MMKVDPEQIIEVFGEEIGRVRAELGMEMDKKFDSAVALSALEVMRGQLKELQDRIDTIGTSIGDVGQLQEGFEAETRKVRSELDEKTIEIGNELAAKADHAVMTQAIDVVRGQFKDLQDQLTALNTGLADVGKLQEGLEETLKAGEAFAQNLIDIGDHIADMKEVFDKGLEEKLDRSESALVLEAMGERIKDLRTHLDAVQQSLLDTGERQQMGEEETVRVFGEIFDSVKSIDARIEERAKEYEKTLAEKVTADDLKSLQEHIETVERDMLTIGEEHSSVKQEALDALEEFRKTLSGIGEMVAEMQPDFAKALEEKLDKETSVTAFEVMRGEMARAIDGIEKRLKKIDEDVFQSLEENAAAFNDRDDRLGKIDDALCDLETKLAAKVEEADVGKSIHDLRADLVALFDEATASIDATVHDITEFAMADIKRDFKEFSVKLREFHIDAEKWLDDMRAEVAEKLAEIKDGEQGPQGEAGQDGKDGATGGPGPAGKDGKDGKDGERGQDAVPWDHLGTHDPAKAYRRNDCVIKDGGTFQSKANNNTSVPGESPLWQLIAARGQRGRPGEPGPQGLSGKGIEGPQGAQGEAALPFIEVRAIDDDRIAFIREDGEVFECSVLPLMAALRGDARAFITEQIDNAVSKAVELAVKELQGSKKK